MVTDPKQPTSPTDKISQPSWLVKYNKMVERPTIKVELEHELTLEKEVLCLRFSHDGKFLAVGIRGDAGKTCIYDVKSGKQAFLLVDAVPDKLGMRSLCFSADDRYLATGHGIIRIWEFTKKYLRSAFRGHALTPDTDQTAVTGLDFSPNGRFLVSSSDDQTVRIWNIRDGSSTVFQDRNSYFKAVKFSQDGEYVAAANADGKLRIWNVRTKQLVRKWAAHDRPIFAVAFAGGSGLVSGSFDHTLKYWGVRLEPRGRSTSFTTRNDGAIEFVGHTKYVRTAAVSPDCQWLASGSEDNSVGIWDTSSASLQCTLEGHRKGIWTVDFSPVGGYLACGSSDSRATIWKYGTAEGSLSGTRIRH